MPRVTFRLLPGHPQQPRAASEELGSFVTSVPTGVRLLDAAQEAGCLVATQCGGVLSCLACVVFPKTPGALSVKDADETEALARLHAKPEARFACQARVHDDVTVFVPPPFAAENR